jgi:hypothetical protein
VEEVLRGLSADRNHAGIFLTDWLSAAEYDRLERDCAPTCQPESWERYRTRERVGWSLLATGGGVLVGGLVWWLLTDGPREERAPAALQGSVLHFTF